MKKKLSLKVELIIYLLLFAFLILSLIFGFQVFFLEDFYSLNKKNSLKKVSDEVVDSIDTKDFNEVTNSINMSGEMCVRVLSNNPSYNTNTGCYLGNIEPRDLENIIEETLNEGNEKLFDNYSYKSSKKGLSFDVLILSKFLQVDDANILILLSTTITPINTTISTIKSQYMIIVVVVCLLTILLALLLSKRFIKPIKKISNEANNLPSGEYKDVNDVSSLELEELNETLIEANKQILKADRAKKEILANVSHDLRTPLTMIVGYGEMIRDIEEENNEENINVIIDEAKRLNVLVDDLLDVARFEENHYSLDLKQIHVNELLESVYHQYEKYCEANNIDLKLQLAEDKVINIDEKRIKQVLYNFINNSINYNSKEDKKVIIGSEKIDDKLRIFIYDNGDGIKNEDKEYIFDRYYKASKNRKREALGSGIGLSLARDILKAHGYEVSVDSEINEYSKFYFDV